MEESLSFRARIILFVFLFGSIKILISGAALLIAPTNTFLKFLKLTFPEDNEISPVNIFTSLTHRFSLTDENYRFYSV